MEAVTNEFYESLCWACYSFAFGVFLREFAPSTFGRWLGRVGVLCAMLVMVLFGNYSIRQFSLLAINANVRNGEGIIHAKREDESTSEISEIGRQIRTPAGHIVTVKFNPDSGSGTTTNPERSMCGAADGTRWSFSRYRQRIGSVERGTGNSSGTTPSIGRMPFAQPSLNEWK